MKQFRKAAAAVLAVSFACQLMTGCKKIKTPQDVSAGSPDAVQITTTAEEAELGEYVISENGVKLYYNAEEFADDTLDLPSLASSLEALFLSYNNNDFEAYKNVLYPEYETRMEKYFQENFNYGLDNSFKLQCERIVALAEGVEDYKVTRLKIEAPAEDATAEFLESLSELIGSDFSDFIEKDNGKIRHIAFYVMAQCGEEEHLIISENELFFVEKDGKYYALG